MNQKKYPYGNMFKIHKHISPLDAMFYRHDLYALKKFQENVYRNMMNYNKKNSKVSEKSIVTDQFFVESKQDRLDILPACSYDIYNYLSRSSMANFEIQAILKLDGKLDFDKLKKAVRLSVDAEPVFGCGFIEEDTPYWKRLDDIDEITFCTLEEADNSDEAVMRFLQSPLDMENDPKVKVKIIRLRQYDILGVKVNKVCGDGTGAKKYIQLLSDIYSCIGQEDGTYTPAPQTGIRKDQDSLFKELGITFPELRENSLPQTPKTNWAFPWVQREGGNLGFAICRLPQGSLESIYQFARSREATVNDLILTAYYRTLFKISNPKYDVPMDISSTVDLRRYLAGHDTQAIRNLTGGFTTRVARIRNEYFEDTLSRVVNETKKIKDSRMGVNNHIDEEYVEKTCFRSLNEHFQLLSQTSGNQAKDSAHTDNICIPGLSNFGYISQSLITFGNNVVTDAFIIPPVLRTPGFLLSASSYNGILTMSIGYRKASISQKDMKELLNMIKNELMRGCAY